MCRWECENRCGEGGPYSKLEARVRVCECVCLCVHLCSGYADISCSARLALPSAHERILCAPRARGAGGSECLLENEDVCARGTE